MPGRIPPMAPDEMETILRHLPEPTQVELRLRGTIEYSSIDKQIEEDIEGFKIDGPIHPIFRMKSPTNDKIVEIYSDRQEMDLQRKKEKIYFDRAIWHHRGSIVELTPRTCTINYIGQEPEYISGLKKDLEGTGVLLCIEGPPMKGK